MYKHEDKICARCNSAFECKSGNITQCQCYGLALSSEEQGYISKQFDDCLCFNCIVALRIAYNTARFEEQIKKYPGH